LYLVLNFFHIFNFITIVEFKFFTCLLNDFEEIILICFLSLKICFDEKSVFDEFDWRFSFFGVINFFSENSTLFSEEKTPGNWKNMRLLISTNITLNYIVKSLNVLFFYNQGQKLWNVSLAITYVEITCVWRNFVAICRKYHMHLRTHFFAYLTLFFLLFFSFLYFFSVTFFISYKTVCLNEGVIRW